MTRLVHVLEDGGPGISLRPGLAPNGMFALDTAGTLVAAGGQGGKVRS